MSPRGPNLLHTASLPLSSNERLERHLERIVRTGFYGKNPTEAAERLLSEKIKDLLVSGELERLERLNEGEPSP